MKLRYFAQCLTKMNKELKNKMNVLYGLQFASKLPFYIKCLKILEVFNFQIKNWAGTSCIYNICGT